MMSIVRMALKSVAKEKTIRELEDRVAHARSNLLLSFLICTMSQGLEKRENGFEEKMLEAMRRASGSQHSLENDLKQLAEKFSTVTIDSPKITNEDLKKEIGHLVVVC